MHRKINLTIPQAILITAIIILATSTISVLAATGSTDSTNAPGLSASYTLEDIYVRLVNGTAASQSTFNEPAVAPGTGSMHDLNDIMSAAPAQDNTNGATTDQVLNGQSFWGLTNGEWGPQTGTIPSGSNLTGTDGDITFAIPDGYYNGNFATAVDNDLQPGNILDGVSIFNVTGNIPSGSNVNGADGALSFAIPDGYYAGKTATASDSDLLAGNILNGVEIFGVTGNIPTGSNVTGANGLLTFNIPDGYYAGKTATASDSDLLAGNILTGVEIFGVTGNIPTRSNVTGADGLLTFDIPDGYYAGKTATASDDDLLANNILAGKNIFGVAGKRYGGCVCNGHMVGDSGTRWCDNENGTITDMKNACLIWLKDASCLGQDIWKNANSDVSALSSGQCGLSDGSLTYTWRLPTREEMLNLARGSDRIKVATPQGFIGVHDDAFWTCNTDTEDPNSIWAVNIETLHASGVDTGSYSIWAVRTD